MSYFLCYELEKVKKEEVDFWTSRHEWVKDHFKKHNSQPTAQSSKLESQPRSFELDINASQACFA